MTPLIHKCVRRLNIHVERIHQQYTADSQQIIVLKKHQQELRVPFVLFFQDNHKALAETEEVYINNPARCSSKLT